MERFKQVSESEFNEFVKSYPSKLDWDVTGICDPPLGSHNDFSLGNWPESMVTKVILHEAMSGHPAYKGEENEYFIKSASPLQNTRPV